MDFDRRRVVHGELHALRMAVSAIISKNSSSLSENNFRIFRRQTAKWLDDAYFDIVKACEATVLLECGAHEASASVRFVSEANRKAVAIEANPHTFSGKTRLTERHGVIAVNAGLGEHDGVGTFLIPKDDSMKGSASFMKKPDQLYDEVSVKLTTVDNIAREFIGEADNIALWVDVEGFALDVLKGGKELLRRPQCRIIKIEVEASEIFNDQATVSSVSEYLSDLDFYPVLRDIQFKNQFNIIYLKNDIIDRMDEIIIQSWRSLSELRVDSAEVNRDRFSAFKSRVLDMSGDRVSGLVHRLAARLGSHSSKALLQDRQKR